MVNLKSKEVKALGLCSGGLDSMLSGLVLRQQGITVEWVTFVTPFFTSHKARKAGRMNNIPVRVENITLVYLEMLKNPPCGYGKHMNPCLDCHALMFKCAGELMKAEGYDFLFSGEVLGQRPMSQTRSSLRYVEKHSGYEGYIVRPLSAQRLPETLPEQKGLVNRQSLLGITGRSRKRQIKLAKSFGIYSYPAPAGGCLLTDKHYALRLRDMFDHQDQYSENELYLLKYGRHLRLEDGTKIIVGRSKSDNERILEHYDSRTDIRLYLTHVPGPTVLITGNDGKNHIEFAAAIAVGYSKAGNDTKTSVRITCPDHQKAIDIYGISPKRIKHLLL